MCGALPQRQLPFADRLAQVRPPLGLLQQLAPGELARATAAQLERGRRLGKVLLQDLGADLRDDPARLGRERVPGLDDVEKPPAARTGGLEPAGVDAAREPERRGDLQHGRWLPAPVALGTEMVDAPVLAPQPARSGVIGRPVPPAIEALDLDLLRARIGADHYALAELEQDHAEHGSDRGDGRRQPPRAYAQGE